MNIKGKAKAVQKIFSVLLALLLVFELIPASLVSAATEANVSLEMNIQSGYTDAEDAIETVESGQPFYVYMRYAMNASTSDYDYLSPTLRVELPDNVEVDLDSVRANSHIADNADGTKAVSLETVSGKNYVLFRFKDNISAGSASTLAFQCHFKNMTTPATGENDPAPTFTATVEGSIVPRGGSPVEFNPVTAQASVKVAASGNWTIDKQVASSGFNADKSYYELEYSIDATLLTADGTAPRDPDSYGRLEFTNYQLTDTLPPVGNSSVISGSGAQSIEVYMDVNGTKTKLDSTQYTIEYDTAGNAAKIVFAPNLYSTFDANDAPNHVEQGASTNSRYYIKLRYPTAAYITPVNENLRTYILNNTARLDYTLADGSTHTVTDNASSNLALYETVTDDYSLTVRKQLRIGGKTIDLNASVIGDDKYAPVSFTLYADEACTTVAKDIHNATLPTLVIDSTNTAGTVTFPHLRHGVYYLKESDSAGFALLSPAATGTGGGIKITVLENGTVQYGASQTAQNNTITVVNVAKSDGFGIVEFTKRGIAADGSKSTLDGYTFALYKVENGVVSQTAAKTAVSGAAGIAGYVRFDAVTPGSYVLREQLTPAQAAIYPQLADIAVTVQGNTVTSVGGGIVTNESNMGVFTVTKTAMDGTTKLSGASFEVYADTNGNKTKDAADTLVASFTAGTYTSAPVAAGGYFLVETAAPAGYKLDSTPQYFEVSARAVFAVTAKDEKLGRLAIYKYGQWQVPGTSQTATIGLAGASFQIYRDSAGTVPVLDAAGNTLTLTTVIDATGQPSYSGTAGADLPSGTYWIKETAAPTGYTLSGALVKVIVYSGESANGSKSEGGVSTAILNGVSIASINDDQDENYGRIQIKKTDAKSGSVLASVTFQIYNETKTTLMGTLVTDSSGEALSDPLPAGKYVVVEQTPTGYKPAQDVAVTVAGKATVLLELQNEPLVSYTIEKHDSATQAVITTGATFELYDADPNAAGAKLLGTYTTDRNGRITFLGLQPGATYWYKETAAPAGYVLDATAHSFTAPDTASGFSQGTAKPVYNAHLVTLVILKQGTYDGEARSLSGATFAVYAASGASATDAAADKAAAGANVYVPAATGAQGTTSVANLLPGWYWVEETAAPAGYTLDAAPKLVHVTGDGNNRCTYTFTDTASTGSLEIEKINSVTDADMQGITFTLYREQNNARTLVSAQKTDANGRIRWDGLDPGVTYALVETVPAGFSGTAEKTGITVRAGEVTRFIGSNAIENEPMGKIKIYKTAEWTGSSKSLTVPLGGARFGIYTDKNCTNKVAEMTTGTNGYATSGWLAEGTYYVKEIAAPVGYILSSAVQTVTVSLTGTKTVFETADPFVNVPQTARIRILKTDRAEVVGLANVTFNVYAVDDANGTATDVALADGTSSTVKLRKVGTVTTDSTGYAVTDPLGVGTYYLEETAAPSGYSYATKWSGPITVTANELGTLVDETVINDKVVRGEGSKTDDRGYAVGGAYIGLFTSKADAEAAAAVTFKTTDLVPLSGDSAPQNKWNITAIAATGTDGKYAFRILNTSVTYYVTELLAPTGYVRNTAVYEIQADAKGAFALPTIRDDRVGSLRITKVYQMSGGDKHALANAVFSLYTATVKSGSNANDKELNKPWNESTSVFQKGSLVSSGMKTSSSGNYKWENLAPGYYILEETGAPAGFAASNKYYIVKVTAGTQNRSLGGSVSSNAVIYNTANSMGEFTLKKVSSTSTNTLLNATFKLEVLSGTTWTEYKLNSTKSSSFSTSNTTYTSEPLPAGRYRITETKAPNGYTVLAAPIEFTVEAGKSTAVQDALGGGLLRNDPQGSITLDKYGIFNADESAKTLLAGVTFQLYADAACTVLARTATYTTNSSGRLTISGLDAGTYYLLETGVGANTAYSNDHGTAATAIKAVVEPGKTTSLTGTSAVTDSAAYGKIQLKKIDNDSKAGLAGAVFELHAAADCADAALGTITTGADGSGLSALLPAGTYYLKEVTVPTGYKLIGTGITGPLTVAPNGLNKTVYDTPIANERMQTVKVIKYSSLDETGKAPLTDGTFGFKLYKVVGGTETQVGAANVNVSANGTRISTDGELTTKTGVLLFEGLDANSTYRVYEISAPANYVLASSPAEFRTGSDGKTQEVYFANTPKGKVQVMKATQWSDGQTYALAGAVFQLYDSATNAAVGAPFTADASGVATSGWVEAGSYYFAETQAPAGFEIQKEANGTPKHYAVTVTAGATNTDYASLSNPVYNNALWGKFTVEKLATGTATRLNGAKFSVYIYDASLGYGKDNVNGYRLLAQDSQYQTSYIQVDGFYESGYVPAGDYYITETAAPAGYTIDPAPIFFTVSSAATVAVRANNNAKGAIVITKVSERSDAIKLDGVEFSLYAGEVTASAPISSLRLVGTAVTDANGQCTFANLDAGTYTILETKAKDGYELDTTLHTVTIGPRNGAAAGVLFEEDVKLTNRANKGIGYIFKYEKTGTATKPLAGAKFNVYTDATCTKLVQEGLVTNAQGYAATKLLTPGAYYVKEVEAPAGYTLDSRLAETGKTITVQALLFPDYTNTDATKRENCVWFENVKATEPTGMDVTMQKSVTPTALAQSLLLADGTVTYKLSDFTTGENSLPLESFQLVDDTIVLRDADGNAVAASKDDYSLTQLVLHKAYNKNDPTAAVTARVSYQLNGAAAWQTAQEIANVQSLSAAGTTVTLPTATAANKVTGIRVEYFGTDVRFTAEPVELSVKFFKRTGSATAAEVVKIDNTAKLAFTYSVNDNKGTKVTKTMTAEANASLTVPTLESAMPTVKLTNVVAGGDKLSHTPGETLSYTVTAANESSNPFEDPVLVIDVPAYTTLDMSSLTVTGPDGKPLTSTNNAASPLRVESIIVSGVKTQRLIFDFEGVTLAKDQKITVKYDTVINGTIPKSVVQVSSPAFLTSTKMVPATVGNPNGTSFKGSTANVAPMVQPVNDSLVQFLGAAAAVKYDALRADAPASIVHSDTVSIVKEQKNGLDGDDAYTGAGQYVYVNPDGTIDYRVTVANSLSSPVRSVRMVDILPCLDDTLVLRSTKTGMTYERSTEVPTSPVLYKPVQITVPGADVIVYYKLDTKWDVASRTANYAGAAGVRSELPMLYANDGSTANTWDGWVTASDIDLSDPAVRARITAIGVDITYKDGTLMQSGDSVQATITLEMPGFTADQIKEFYDKKVANSAAASVREDGKTKPWIVENLQVVSYMRLPLGSIGDYVFFDNNANGLQDAGDTAATGVAVQLTRTDHYADGSVSRSFSTTKTDANGYYLFDNLACNYQKTVDPNADPNDPSKTISLNADKTTPSNYVGDVYTEYEVKFTAPVATDGSVTYAPTTRYAGSDRALDSDIDANGRSGSVTLTVTEQTDRTLVGETNLTVDAGYVAPCSLGDYVWEDTNRNGLQDETGTGIADAVVRLYRVDTGVRTLTATTQTDSTGYYLFENLVPGQYEVEFDISALVKSDGYTYKYAFTAAEQGTVDDIDSDAAVKQDADDRVRRTATVSLAAGENNRSVDAGLTVYSALGGFIFDDRNYNDKQDLMYPLGGTVVRLYGSTNGAIDKSKVLGEQTVDGITGRFYFDNLIEGVYYLEYDFPDGYTAVQAHSAFDANGVNDTTLDSDCATDYVSDTTAIRNSGLSMPISLPYDTVDTTWDAGAYKLGTIGDYVWFDSNKDGLQDANENGVAGVKVTLQSRSTNLGSANYGVWGFEAAAVTDANGYYIFHGLEGGVDAGIEYRVIFDPDPKYENTLLHTGSDTAVDSDAQDIYITDLGYPTDTIFLGYGQTDLTWDMGLVEVTSSLGDYIWYDANHNGIQEDGEAVLKGVLCILEFNGSGKLDDPNAWVEVNRMVTGDNGRYRFDNLAEGYYRVEVAIPSNYVVTSLERGAGTDSNEYDSDAIHRTASSSAFALGGAGLTLNSAAGMNWLSLFGLNVTPGKTIDQTGTSAVTYYRTRTVYLERNTVDLSWDVGVYTVNTGDTSSVTMWLGIGSMALAGLMVLWYILNRKRLREEEEGR